MRRLLAFFSLLAALSLVGCAAPTKSTDYTSFKASRPRSILVLPPINESPDVHATYGLLSQVTFPLAESGYYVLPVALVDETFRQNGLTTPSDIQSLPPQKLRDIFGADAALYMTVSEYGSKYQVVQSSATVQAAAKLVDLKTGDTLWTGSARASSSDGNNNSGGGILGMLISAALTQIINSATDASFGMAGVAANRLLLAGPPAGILYGPRSPKYQSD
ncbi:MAG: DUF799 domain-containing protein [Burkholderiaceae bacterium]|nr:DUF799 domain-containing protein [Burkholderiaceae bacterium]